MGRGVQGLDGLQLVVVEVEHGEVAAGGQVRDLGDALQGGGVGVAVTWGRVTVALTWF